MAMAWQCMLCVLCYAYATCNAQHNHSYNATQTLKVKQQSKIFCHTSNATWQNTSQDNKENMIYNDNEENLE